MSTRSRGLTVISAAPYMVCSDERKLPWHGQSSEACGKAELVGRHARGDPYPERWSQCSTGTYQRWWM